MRKGTKPMRRSSFPGLSARTLNPETAGHVAVIQSALVANGGPDKARRLLDQARVLARGTLMRRDSFVRRELVLADQITDIDKFTFLSSEYIWRFPGS